MASTGIGASHLADHLLRLLQGSTQFLPNFLTSWNPMDTLHSLSPLNPRSLPPESQRTGHFVLEVVVNRRLAFCASLCMSYSLSLAAAMQAQTPGPTSQQPATPVDRYAYAIGSESAPFGGGATVFVTAYSINHQTGYLRPLQSSPIAFENFGIVVDPSNKFVYIPDGFEIFAYRIATNGSLQALTGSPFALQGGNIMVFTPNGKFAYSNLETEFSLNSTTGALTQIGSANTGGSHLSIAINPAGSFVYVLNGDNTISVFAINQTSGVLTEITGSPFASGQTNLNAAVVSPNSKFLFVTTTGTSTTGSTAVFTINSTTGALTPVAGSPFSTPGGGNGIVASATSKFIYFAGDNLSAYSINATTGALTAVSGSPYTLPAAANSLKLDPTGKYLYLPLSLSPSATVPAIVTYSVNSSSGALAEVAEKGFYIPEALAISQGSAAVAYTPKFAYSTNSGSNSISEWSINDTTGALTTVAGSAIADKNGPQLIAAAPSGAFVYSGNSNSSISEYRVNATTGVLSLVSGSPIKGFGSVSALLVDPTSSFLFVLDSGNQAVDMYTITAKTGALTFLSSLSTIPHAQTLTLDPTGNIAIVTGSSAVQTYLLVKGGLKVWASATTTNPLSAVAADQSSQYILVTESSSKSLLSFSLIPSGDSITLTQVSSASTGNNPTAILAEPSGKYVYVANSGDGTISAYSLNNSTGALKQVGSAVKAAAGTDSLATSNDGKYLYATGKSAGLVSIFKINSTGTLTADGSATTGTSPTSIATTGTNQ